MGILHYNHIIINSCKMRLDRGKLPNQSSGVRWRTSKHFLPFCFLCSYVLLEPRGENGSEKVVSKFSFQYRYLFNSACLFSKQESDKIVERIFEMPKFIREKQGLMNMMPC